MRHSKIRCYSIPVSLLLALLLFASAVRGEVPLRAFTATYDLQQGSLSLGTATLSLEPMKNSWRWRLTTRARGIYAMFIRKKPYSETTFSQQPGNVRLLHIKVADDKDDSRAESASFDWKRRQLNVVRKGKTSQLALNSNVHDYQSIHLLAADMQLRRRQVSDMKFYRKGKLIDSRLTYLGEKSVEIEGKEFNAHLYQQTFNRSDTRIDYFYDARNPLLPLLIERRESGEKPSTLRLSRVDWRS